MRITESRLRRLIREILSEIPRKYDHITSYIDLKEEHGFEVENLITLIANRIYKEETRENAEALKIEYEQMCLDADLGEFADDIIADAYKRHRDQYWLFKIVFSVWK